MEEAQRLRVADLLRGRVPHREISRIVGVSVRTVERVKKRLEAGDDLTLNVDYTLQYLIQLGARPEKTVLGVPFYGRAFSLINPNENNIGDKTKDTSFQVNSTQIWFLCYLVNLLFYSLFATEMTSHLL